MKELLIPVFGALVACLFTLVVHGLWLLLLAARAGGLSAERDPRLPLLPAFGLLVVKGLGNDLSDLLLAVVDRLALLDRPQCGGFDDEARPQELPRPTGSFVGVTMDLERGPALGRSAGVTGRIEVDPSGDQVDLTYFAVLSVEISQMTIPSDFTILLPPHSSTGFCTVLHTALQLLCSTQFYTSLTALTSFTVQLYILLCLLLSLPSTSSTLL